MSFLIGYFFNKIFLGRINFCLDKGDFSDKHNIKYKTIPRYRLLYLLGILSLLFTLYTFINTVRQAGTLHLGIIQTMLQEGEIVSNNNGIMNAIELLIISPIRFVLPAITAVDFWFGKRDIKLLVVTICLILLTVLSSANRTSFLLFFVWLIVVAQIYLYHNKRKKNRICNSMPSYGLAKIRKRTRIIAVITIMAFLILTLSRGVSRIYRQLYLYFAMPPKMFEIWADKIELNNVYGYGTASLLGFLYPIFYVVKNLLGIDTPQLIQSIYDWIMLTDSIWVWPGKNITANAYVSIFWFLYLDYREIGIIIGMFAFGFILSRIFMHAIKSTYSEKQICVYCCMFYAVLFSYVRMQFSQMRFALGLIFVLLFVYRKVPITNKEE